ncbi:MAG: 4Fe-4S binding protein [Erysipelotrichaceae bacterium]|nr:4Fe-4S binding protein [Erysipelotrichaceae bacterium]
MPAKVDQEVCLGCGACTGVCPVGAIALDDSGKACVDQSLCIDCGACVATCPVSAISQE